MDQARTTPSPVEVLWRPGCPFCSRLRRGLRRAGVETQERNIWSDPQAAALVRAVTGGDETVPTVMVGERGLVNPSVSDVVSALRSEFPEHVVESMGPREPGMSARGGAAWTIAVGLLWVALVVWRPTTTWHLAPMLMAGSWPWLLAQARPTRESGGRARVLIAGIAGYGAAGLTTLALSHGGLLRGPTLPGFTSAPAEALILAGAAAVLAVLIGLLRSPRARTSGPS